MKWSIVGGVVVAIASIMGYVILGALGGEAADDKLIFLFATPLVTVLIGKPMADDVKQIKKQTNGLLQSQIDKAATRAANEVVNQVVPTDDKAMGTGTVQETTIKKIGPR